MSAAGPPQGANCAPSGGSAAAALATPAASVGYIIAPRKLAMGNGIDSHCHVFDTARFPYSPDAAYQPPPHEAGGAWQETTGGGVRATVRQYARRRTHAFAPESTLPTQVSAMAPSRAQQGHR